jgi:hypothetical protein
MQDEVERLVTLLRGCDRALQRLSEETPGQIAKLRREIEQIRDDALARLAEIHPGVREREL